MNRVTTSLLIMALMQACATIAPAAEDGPLRQRLKERRMERERARDSSVDAPITRAGDHTFTIQHDGMMRRYRVHVPTTYAASRPVALLVALHGGGGNMNYQATDARYGLISASDRDGFVVAFPNGYSKRPDGSFATWNAGRCCGAARDNNIDDVGFIRQVVANLTRQMNIDRARVYATGMSNGGLMSYRLACEASDVFTAIAPVAGTDNTIQCTPKRAVPVVHFHAKNDDHVAFTGGAGPNAAKESVITDFTSVPDSINKWVKLNGCAATPRRVLEKPGAYCERYESCRDGAAVQLCVTEEGAHSWPGAPKSRGEPASQAISANELMWEFFEGL